MKKIRRIIAVFAVVVIAVIVGYVCFTLRQFDGNVEEIKGATFRNEDKSVVVHFDDELNVTIVENGESNFINLAKADNAVLVYADEKTERKFVVVGKDNLYDVENGKMLYRSVKQWTDE